MDIENIISWLLALVFMVGPFLIPFVVKMARDKKKKENRENRPNTQTVDQPQNPNPQPTTLSEMTEMFETLMGKTKETKPSSIPELSISEKKDSLEDNRVSRKSIENQGYYQEYIDKINKDSISLEIEEEEELTPVIEDFDLHEAVIYSEIIKPKYF